MSVTESGLSVHPLVKVLKSVAEGLGLIVTVAVGPAASCMLKDAALFSLSLARDAWIPVAAPSPIAAADSRAITHERVSTSTEQPSIFLGSFLRLCAVVEENGKGELPPAWLTYDGSRGFVMATL